MNTEQAIVEKVKELSFEKQQEVLAFIGFLNTDEWQQQYQKRFRQLREEIQVGVEAADRGEVIDADMIFQNLRDRLRLDNAQIKEKMSLVEEMRRLFRETQALVGISEITDDEIAEEIAAYRRGE